MPPVHRIRLSKQVCLRLKQYGRKYKKKARIIIVRRVKKKANENKIKIKNSTHEKKSPAWQQ
jgi:hypothetical protein